MQALIVMGTVGLDFPKIFFMSSDVVFPPGRITTVAAAIETHSEELCPVVISPIAKEFGFSIASSVALQAYGKPGTGYCPEYPIGPPSAGEIGRSKIVYGA
jgi:hypothetical protein